MQTAAGLQSQRHYHFFAALVAGIIITLLLVSSDTVARQGDGTRASGAIDAKTFAILMKAQELTEQDQFERALQELDKVKDNDRLNSYAKSQMWNFYAYIYASQEKYQRAIEAYQRVIAEPGAPEGLQLTSKYTLAQLYFQLEDYTSVINFMEEWFREVDKPTATAHIILAQAYFQNRSYDPALKNLLTAIDMTNSEGKPVDENWLRMKAAIYFEKNDLKNTLAAYEELNQHYPRITYLKQMAGLYGEVGKDRKRLTTFDAVYLKGGLTSESDILNLAYMYLGQEIPYKAGKIIENNIKKGLIKPTPKNVETLANAWAQANEHKKAIPTLEKAAALSDKGILYARLAGVYFDAGNFRAAAEAARLADKKGGLKRRDNNQMLLGMSYFNIKAYEKALQAFRRAKQSKKNFTDAHKWEKYTLSELERLKTLQESKFRLTEKTGEVLTADENTVEAIGGNLLKGHEKPTDSKETAKDQKPPDKQ